MKIEASSPELGAIIFEGLKKAFQKLVEEKRKNKGTLVFSENGKIVRYTPK
ncbi:MAG: hypothetical protein ABIQ02_08420 [Saprospiraceae bacterium]